MTDKEKLERARKNLAEMKKLGTDVRRIETQKAMITALEKVCGEKTAPAKKECEPCKKKKAE